MSNNTFEFRPSGSIDFEPVVLPPAAPKTQAQAQAPVDDGLDHDPLSVLYGRSKDSKPTSIERMLAGATIDWLVAFPVDARPKALCERFPHVANRLAKDWFHPARSAQALELLAGDARWGSAGFPGQVQSELQRLLQRLTGTK